jgi:hypothetical protein
MPPETLRWQGGADHPASAGRELRLKNMAVQAEDRPSRSFREYHHPIVTLL